MRFKGYPKAYRRNARTKLLYLYKTGFIGYIQYCNACTVYNCLSTGGQLI